MLALRYVYVLALVVWLGGMVVLGAIVAPATFQVLQASAPSIGRALAGDLFGQILARFHYVAYACGGVLLVTLVAMAAARPATARVCRAARRDHRRCSLVALYSGFVVLQTIDAIQREVGRLPSLLPAGRRPAHPLRRAASALDTPDDGEHRRRAGAAVLGSARPRPMTHTITLIPGDGIGPEVTAAVVRILERAGLEVEWEPQLAGVLALERHGDTLPGGSSSIRSSATRSH